MRRHAKLHALGCALVAAATLAAAQGPVYESKDKAGPVFSDQPSPGAKPIELGPPSVIQTTPVPQQQPAAPAAGPAYTLLVISAPENQGTIHSSTGEFDVSIRTAPALRMAAGDRVRVKLDGNLLPQSYRSASLRVTEADWQGAARADSVEHTLQAVIVDQAGAVLIESAPINFFAHRATVRRERR